MTVTRNATLRLASFAVWLLLALCLCFWGLRLWPAGDTGQAPPPGYTPPSAPDPVAIARVLGPAPAASAATHAGVDAPADKLVLRGVVSNRASQGVALIAVNDKPAQPFRVGGQIAERYVLRQVDARSAVLVRTDGGSELTLELAAPNPDAPAAMRPAAAPPRAVQPPARQRPDRLQRPAVQPVPTRAPS